MGIPNELSNFDQLPDSAHVRVRIVAALYACSIPTVWRNAGKSIPAPVKLTDNITAWRVGELRAALGRVKS